MVDLGLPLGRHPSAATRHRSFTALDVMALERIVADWLAGAPPTSPALDSKTLQGGLADRGSAVQLVTAFAQPAQAVLAELRDHSGIENKLRWVRDETLGEDRCRVWTGAAPEVFALCRNLALKLLRRRGIAAIAPALRTYVSRWWIALSLVQIAGAGLS